MAKGSTTRPTVRHSGHEKNQSHYTLDSRVALYKYHCSVSTLVLSCSHCLSDHRECRWLTIFVQHTHASQLYCLAKKLLSNSPTKAETVFHCPMLSPLSALTSKMEVVCGVSPESLLRTRLVVDPSTVLSL